LPTSEARVGEAHPEVDLTLPRFPDREIHLPAPRAASTVPDAIPRPGKRFRACGFRLGRKRGARGTYEKHRKQDGNWETRPCRHLAPPSRVGRCRPALDLFNPKDATSVVRCLTIEYIDQHNLGRGQHSTSESPPAIAGFSFTFPVVMRDSLGNPSGTNTAALVSISGSWLWSQCQLVGGAADPSAPPREGGLHFPS
jgi:hypothetical protein